MQQGHCEPFEFGPESPNTDALYSSFSDWCRMQTKFDHEGFQIFARGLQQRIHHLKWEAGSKRSNRGTVWSLRLKADRPDECKKIFGLAAGDSEAVPVDAETNGDQGDAE